MINPADKKAPIMKRFILPVFLSFTVAGCSSTHIFSVHNALTDEPMEDVWIERRREHWYAPFVFAPGATFYYLVSSNQTDSAGSVTYKGNPKEDRFRLYMPANMPWNTPLRVKIDNIETTIDVRSKKTTWPPEEDIMNGRTYYSISMFKRKKTLLWFLHVGGNMYMWDP